MLARNAQNNFKSRMVHWTNKTEAYLRLLLPPLNLYNNNFLFNTSYFYLHICSYYCDTLFSSLDINLPLPWKTIFKIILPEESKYLLKA